MPTRVGDDVERAVGVRQGRVLVQVLDRVLCLREGRGAAHGRARRFRSVPQCYGRCVGQPFFGAGPHCLIRLRRGRTSACRRGPIVRGAAAGAAAPLSGQSPAPPRPPAPSRTRTSTELRCSSASFMPRPVGSRWEQWVATQPCEQSTAPPPSSGPPDTCGSSSAHRATHHCCHATSAPAMRPAVYPGG